MQLFYDRQQGYPGSIAEGGITDVKSYAVGEDLPYGAGFTLNAKGQAVPPAAAADASKIVGIALKSPDIANHDDKDFPYFKTGETLAGLVKGTIWVRVEEPVDAGDQVHIRHAAEPGKPSGVFGKSGAGKAAVTGLTFMTSSYFRSLPPTTYPGGTSSTGNIGYAMVRI